MAQNQIDDELANLYQQKTDKQHVLDNPDTYIGSIEIINSDMWIMDKDGTKIVEKNINYIPGLFKLFDEGIVNCRDHYIRMKTLIDEKTKNPNITTSLLPVTYIDISIQPDGTIIMCNDGNGIDVAKHPQYGIWIPELIFGNLRTSTNYDKDKERLGGGKNGFGFKLALVWSTYGCVETVDHIRGLKYIQEFKNNLDEICPPIVTKCKSKPYTKITFRPDYARFKIDGLDIDFMSLFHKRVMDIAAITDKSIKVKYNTQPLQVKTFQNYVDLYIGNDKKTNPRVYDSPNERWEYAVALSSTHEFAHVSFVNGIYTCKGGKHVEYIINQLTRKLVDYIEGKKKIKVNPSSIKEQLIIFVRCDIVSPAFESQTKDYMNTPVAKFGSTCEVTNKVVEAVVKMGVMDVACALNDIKGAKLAKKNDGAKTNTVRGIAKLVDANWAGTVKSNLTTLIITEGDSAKSGVISGMSKSDRDIFGIYPLKGKLLNPRSMGNIRMGDNKEITELKKIIGLKTGVTYSNMADVHAGLRYSHILFMTDQDLDGSHIKGLCINLFQHEWTSLFKIDGFMGFMNTPILKAKRANKEIRFYNEGEYSEWKRNNNNGAGWVIKYYKGLGTSTKHEFTEYFKEKKIVDFKYNGPISDDSIDMVFNKKRSSDRKVWLEQYDKNSYIDTRNNSISYEDFVNNELIHFSKYDCDRSIPSLMDGLKTSLRKILFSAFKKNLTSEIKVAQFSGYVSEHSCYHHGEASLNQAIVGLAQNFTGSNNINTLFPAGQFGSRLQGGKDSASERYIFTHLTPITRFIYRIEDDGVLTYLNDDGTLVEPSFYVPIIPMILVNGSRGIGTGFSTHVLRYNTMDIIRYIIDKLSATTNNENEINNFIFTPYYEGFKGRITNLPEKKILISGIYEKIGQDKINISELPVEYWTDDFRQLLIKLRDGEDTKSGDKDKNKNVTLIVKSFIDNSSDTQIDFTVTFIPGKLDELEAKIDENGFNGVYNILNLLSIVSTTNMNLFNEDDKLIKYESVNNIIDDYMKIRLKYYELRKNYLIKQLTAELEILTNKTRYITEIIQGTIDLRNKSKVNISELLRDKSYTVIDGDNKYEYLVKMRMDSVNTENVNSLRTNHAEKANEIDKLRATTLTQIWISELEELKKEYVKYKNSRCEIPNEASLGNKSVKKLVVKKAQK